MRVASWGLMKPGIAAVARLTIRNSNSTTDTDRDYNRDYLLNPMDDDFNKDRAILVRDLANNADPFTRKRLLDLAIR